MLSATPAIEIAGLEKHYGATRAVDGLSLSVATGEVFGLLGPNGAGKTTTVEILEGYRQPDQGTVRVLGLDPVRDGAKVRPRIGVMLQEGGLYPGIRPLEALRLFASYYDDPDDPDRLLDLVGLREAEHTMVRRMSGGQQQRLSLALALIGRPELVFLDEPTAGMDPHARATTWRLVRELRDHGVTVVLTTHGMDEAEQLCDRVAIVDHGRLVACGTPSDSRVPPPRTRRASPPPQGCRSKSWRRHCASTRTASGRSGPARTSSRRRRRPNWSPTSRSGCGTRASTSASCRRAAVHS